LIPYVVADHIHQVYVPTCFFTKADFKSNPQLWNPHPASQPKILTAPSEDATSFRRPTETVKKALWSRESERCYLIICWSKAASSANDEQLADWKEAGMLPK
jgi:hypothetical protein